MSTDHINDQPGAEVVPLRAEDAATETRVIESPGPAYTDLSDGRAQRKPIFPAHWRTWAAAREHVRLAAARHGHAAAYHGVRAPAYLPLTLCWALVGIIRAVSRLLAWWHVPGMASLERQAAADGLLLHGSRRHGPRLQLLAKAAKLTSRDLPEGRRAGTRGHTCRWVRQRCDLYADAQVITDAQCRVGGDKSDVV